MSEEAKVEAVVYALAEVIWGFSTEGERERVRAIIATALADARERALGEAVAACREQQQVFLSPEYATGQPLASFQERFACGRCLQEIEALRSPA